MKTETTQITNTAPQKDALQRASEPASRIPEPTAPEQATMKPSKRLTRKQQTFVQHLIENPKASATQAAAAAYNVTSRHTAEVIASENMRKPEILLELSKYSTTAENTVIEVMQYSKELGKKGNTAGASYATTALSAANSLLDRVHGKATQKIEQSTTAVTLNIDLTA